MFNIRVHFVLECASQEEWLQRCELSNLPLDRVQQDVWPYLSCPYFIWLFFAFITFHLDFVWLCCSWTLEIIHAFAASFVRRCTLSFLDVVCCWLGVLQGGIRTLQRSSFSCVLCWLWMMHFVFAVYPNAVACPPHHWRMIEVNEAPHRCFAFVYRRVRVMLFSCSGSVQMCSTVWVTAPCRKIFVSAVWISR